MKVRTNHGKIPYAFTPIPNFFLDIEVFSNANLVRFALWAFYRTSFSKGEGEFSYGRERCSLETGISEQRLRTIINQLVNQGIIQKVTTKSTSKFSVYTWVWERFSGFCNQPCNLESTPNQPQTNHTFKNKKEEKEASSTPAAALRLEGKAKLAFDALGIEEKGAVLDLLHARSKTQKILNVEGWIIECIKHNWHHSMKIEMLSSSEKNAAQIKANRQLAQDMLPQLEAAAELNVYLRQDFLDLQWQQNRWMIFFHEDADVFRKQLDHCCKKIWGIPKPLPST